MHPRQKTRNHATPLTSHTLMPQWSNSRIQEWTGGRWTVEPAAPPNSVSHDTRNLTAGALFVAIRGERFDGHDFVEQAVARGAGAVLVEEREVHRVPAGVGCLAVPDSTVALGRFARGYRLSLTARFWGITGSVAKTTVKELLADCLSGGAPVCRTRGNWNNDIGLPLSLLAMEADHREGVFEVAMNRPGDISRLAEILRPDLGVITPVGMAHTELFEKGEEGVADEKGALAEAVSPDGFCVLSADLPWYGRLRARAACRLVTVALEGDAAYRGEIAGDRLRVRTPSKDVHTVPIPQGGRFMARNALLAAAAALEAGSAPGAVAEAFSAYRPLPARWQVEQADGVMWIHDAYNANPLSMKAAVDAFRETEANGRRMLVLGGMRELGRESAAAHEELGRYCAGGDWTLLTVGEAARAILQGARAAGHPEHRLLAVPDVEQAAAYLQDTLSRGDAVLLKASRGEALERVLEIVCTGREGEQTC